MSVRKHDLAIHMYKKHKSYDNMVRLVAQHRKASRALQGGVGGQPPAARRRLPASLAPVANAAATPRLGF